MDPITAAVVAALTAGAATGLTTAAKDAIADGYEGLKSLLKNKWGHRSKVAVAVDELEATPDSASRKGVLAEEVAGAGLSGDAEIMAAAEKLLQLIQAQPTGAQLVQTARGVGIAQNSGSGSASVRFATMPPLGKEFLAKDTPGTDDE